MGSYSPSQPHNLSKQQLTLGELQQSHLYVMMASDAPDQQGTCFYEVLGPMTDVQFKTIEMSVKCLCMTVFLVDCILRADNTVVLTNVHMDGPNRNLTLELDVQGNGHPINKHNLH